MTFEEMLQKIRDNRYRYIHLCTCPACATEYGMEETHYYRNDCALCRGQRRRAEALSKLFEQWVGGATKQELWQIFPHIPHGYWRFRVADRIDAMEG